MLLAFLAHDPLAGTLMLLALLWLGMRHGRGFSADSAVREA